jgi:hypothetical protein
MCSTTDCCSACSGTDPSVFISNSLTTLQEAQALLTADQDNQLKLDRAMIQLLEEEAAKLRRSTLNSLGDSERHGSCFTETLALARTLWRYYKYMGSSESIEECIHLYREAISALGGDSGNMLPAHVILDLAQALQDRFSVVEDVEDLENAVDLCHHMLDHAPYDWVLRAATQRILGTALCSRFEYSMTREADIEEALSLHAESLESTSVDDADYHLALVEYGWAHIQKFHLSGNLEDLEGAYTMHLQALDSCAPSHVDRAEVLFRLGVITIFLYKTYGRQPDLHKSVWFSTQAWALRGKLHTLAHPRCCSQSTPPARCSFQSVGTLRAFWRVIGLVRHQVFIQQGGFGCMDM